MGCVAPDGTDPGPLPPAAAWSDEAVRAMTAVKAVTEEEKGAEGFRKVSQEW